MATSVTQLRARCTGGVGGELAVEPAIVTNGTADGSRTHANLVTGDNTIPIPTGTGLVIATPPAGNVTAIKFGGAAGTRLHNTGWNAFRFDSSVTSFVLNAAAPVAAVEFAFL